MSDNLTVMAPIPRIRKDTNLKDLWDLHIRLKGDIALNSRRRYDVIGRSFCGFMDGKTLNVQTILEWCLYSQTLGHNPRNTNANSVYIRTFLRWLKTIKYTDLELAYLIKTLASEALPEPQIFSEDEYERVKRFCTARPQYQPHLWLFILGYRTGMTLIDCCHLRWGQVHMEYNGPSYIEYTRIKIRRHGAKVTVPVVPFSDVHDWLVMLKEQEHLNYKRHDGITDFVHQDCPGLYFFTKWRLGMQFTYIFQKCGITGKSFKNLRNTFCSNLVNSGVSSPLVCQMTGHSGLKMLLRYLKPDKRALQDGLITAYKYATEQSAEQRRCSGLEPVNTTTTETQGKTSKAVTTSDSASTSGACIPINR